MKPLRPAYCRCLCLSDQPAVLVFSFQCPDEQHLLPHFPPPFLLYSSLPLMAAQGSLKNIFENPLPESLSSWTELLPKAQTETSFDMFGDICHRVKSESSHNYPPAIPLPTVQSPRLDKATSWNGTMSENGSPFDMFGELCHISETDQNDKDGDTQELDEKLAKSTRGSLKDGENVVNGSTSNGRDCNKKAILVRSSSDTRSRYNNGTFPPPITSIGRCGRPRVYFKSYRQDGRFVLREIRIPTQQLLQSSRQDGRFRMQIVSPVADVARRGEEKGERAEADNEEQEEGS